MSTTLNDKPFKHHCYHGTVFKAARCDFVGGVTAYAPPTLSEEMLMADATELGHWHALNILPRLNGFTGPVEITIRREKYVAEPVLETPLLTFFDRERLLQFGGKAIVARVVNMFKNEREYRQEKHLPPIDTVGQFLQQYTSRDLLRVPNMGRRGIQLIQKVLAASGLGLSS